MAILKFNQDEVRKLVAHVKASATHPPLYGKEIGPALLLVGDHGVYLMPNASPPLMKDGSIGVEGQIGARYVVYAEGINPDVDEFDDWWEKKNTTFGGDDGVEPLPLQAVESALTDLKPGQSFRISLTTKHLRILV